ncbi:MAG: GAF domain-containing protein [Chloroflexota bacterium]
MQGFVIALAGLGVLILVYAVLRIALRVRQVSPTGGSVDWNIPASQDAVLVIQAGGRVAYANQTAREWFGETTADEPNIERMVRRIRPSETFWQLCRAEGQARLSLNGTVVEATSYRILADHAAAMASGAVLVALRRPESDGVNVEQSRLSDEALIIFADLTQAIAASKSIEATLEAILNCLEKIVPADLSEVTVWDAHNQHLVPYRSVGVSGVDRHIERVSDVFYEPNDGYSGYLVTHRTPLLIQNVDTFRSVRLSTKRPDYPFRSYLGVPLLVAGELVGTLEVASLTANAFREQELELVSVLAGQAAVGLYNTMLIQDELDRGRELAGLAQIAHAIGASGDPHNLFVRLVESIQPLLNVKSLGFLMYDANRRSLEAQRPFVGIPDQTIGLYRVVIEPGTPAEDVWLAQETVMAPVASEEPRLKALGLDYLATAAGIIQTVLVPLTVAGRSLGYLQISDKADLTPFTEDDIRLAEIIASQAATIIENANLVQQTQERAQRAEALRRIASLTGSVATLDEILQFSVRELAQLLRSDMAAIFLLHQDVGSLQLHTLSLFGVSPQALTEHLQLSLDAAGFRATATATQQVYFTGNVKDDGRIPAFYRGMAEKLEVQSLVVVPLLMRGRGTGELLLGSRANNFFHRSDVSLVVTTASQLTIAIEKSLLLGQTDESLRRRVEQLTALAHIGREINATIDLGTTLQLVFDELVRTTQADCGNIYLFDSEAVAMLPAQSTTPKISLSIGEERRRDSLSNLEMWAVRKEALLTVRDFAVPVDLGDEDGPEKLSPPHESIRSSMLVPIHYQGGIAGLIHLHARTVGLFDEAAQEIAQTLATQAAIALGNAERYQEMRQRNELLNRRVETLSKLFESSQSVHVEQPLDESLETIAYAIQEATPFNVVLISTYDKQTNQLVRKAGVGLPLEVMDELRSRSQSWNVIRQFISPEFRISHSYFVPRDRHPVKPATLHLETAPSTQFGFNGDHWHAEDILLIPMYEDEEHPIGLISVDAPRNGLRPDRPTIEALEVFASQATFVIQSWQKMEELQIRSDTLQRDIEQIRASTVASQVQLPILLHKDVEQTLAIQRLSQRTQRIRAGLDIAEIVNRQFNRPNVLLALGQEMLTRLDMDVVLVAEPSTGGLHLLNVLGEVSANINPETLLGQRNPLRQSLQNGELLLMPNLENSDWRGTPLLQALDAKSFLCLPIHVDGAVDSAVLALSRKTMLQITAEDEQVFHLVARQVAIALQNLRLLTETSRRLQEVDLLLDFSRQLGSLNPASILNTLVESARKVVPAAQAVMIALWQADERVLMPHHAVGYRDDDLVLQIPYHSGEALPGQVFEHGEPLRVEEVDFARQYNLPPELLLRYRDANGGLLPISSLVVPIQTLENKLGVMVLDNFKEPGMFTADDQALVTSLAQQTALALENARLFQSAERRTAQLQALTNVASTITSSLQTDELIASLLDQMKTVLPYETGTLWLRQGQQVTVRAARGFEDSDERVGLSVTISESLLLDEMIKTSRPISVGDVREDIRFPSLLEPRYFSWLGVPLLSKGEVVGVIALEKLEANYYTSEHLQVAMTFAGQAAVALENANLFEESARRALALDQRSQRLALLNRLSVDLSSTLDVVQILSAGLSELIQAINCTAGAALLFDDAGNAQIEVEIPQAIENLPVQLPETPLFARLRETQGIFSTEDVSQEIELLPLAQFLAAHETRAAMILPLATGSDVHGLLLVYQSDEYRFSPDEVELARTISNQVAVAIQNAQLFGETQRLFAETRQHSAELALLFEMGVNVSQVLDQQKLMEATFENVVQLTQADAVIVALINDDDTFTLNGLDKGERLGPMKREMSGKSYSELVLTTGAPVLISDTQSGVGQVSVPGEQIGDPVRCWLGVPLTVRGAAIGVISVQSYQPNLFDIASQRLLVQVANQLAIAFDNARLLSAAQDYAANLEKSVNERTEQLAREHRRTQTLLGIISELSTSLDLDLVLNRTLRVINDTLGSEHSLIMLINPDEATLQLRASLGYSAPVPKGGIASTLKVNEGLAGWVISNRQATLINDLWEDWRWVRRDDQTDLHRSALAVPLVIGEENLGAMLLFHRQPNFFTPDQLELVQATAKQIAVALNNAQLFRLIRDQAERLGDMLRTQHIETSRSQAILEAVADGVLVTDVQGKITLFNDSAEKVLGLGRQQVVGRSLEHFLGLFGKAGQTWVETIRTWSEDPTTYKPGDIYAEQIELDNRRVVAVHLSPVRLRSDFLGTVSIFRDITHMVEVDRLKSEFVATVSHELRTPMTSIKGYVDVMLMGATGQLSEQQSHFLKIVKSNTERLAILVNDLLDISRIEAGRATLSMQPVDVAKVVEASVADLKRRMEEENRSMQVDVDIPATLPHTYGDTERVRQIIDNLLENAYQYTPAEEWEGRITVTAQQTNGDVQVDVKDNGIGISEEEQERVFERFYRGEDPLVLATSGTGLGLSIVQRLVEMHNGRIWMESTGVRGAGSTFSFTLPVASRESSEA